MWILKKFKVVGYEGYKKNDNQYKKDDNPNFKFIDNTLTLYTKNIQGAALTLYIQDTSTNSSIYKDISHSMAQFTDISVSKTDTETKIIMPMDNVFASGKAVTSETGKKWLLTLANVLKDKNYKEIRVEGHTDNTPIKGKYPSNWELSIARASDAVRYMIQEGIENSKIAAVGYADTRPIADNNSKENKAKNRRIKITVVGNADITDKD